MTFLKLILLIIISNNLFTQSHNENFKEIEEFFDNKLLVDNYLALKDMKKGEDKVVLRSDVAIKNCWDIKKMYPSLDKWYEKLEKIKKNGFDSFLAYKGVLKESPVYLKKTLDNYFFFNRSLENLFVYAHLFLDEDLGNDKAKEAYGRISTLRFDFKEISSWMEPEILQIKKEKLEKFINAKELKEYKFYLKKLFNLKKYTLTIEGEKLLASVSRTFQTPSKTFSSFNNADIVFDKVVDSKGNLHELTHGKYLLFLKEEDRVLRKSAFESLHKRFLSFENTLCEIIQGQIKTHVFLAKTRGFKNCLEAALYPNNIDLNVFYNLIKTVKSRINVLHKFVKIKKELLKLKKIHPYDLYAPLVKNVSFEMSIEEAKKNVIESVGILKSEYKSILKKGLFKDRWVDFCETARKRSGAYSSGCYDSMPYILMNFHSSLNDVLTLAHEAGHSMHTYLSNKNQSYCYSDYPIFVAEVASTFNEQLLFEHLFKNTKSKGKKALLLSNKINAIHATFFRQTLFAEFELKLHEIVEKGNPLTPSILKKVYRELYSEYYGEDLALDEYIDIEWARIPHFYYNYYVYQYATGISAAIALFEKMKKNKNHCQEYLKFLKSGGSRYPLDMLKDAGVDLRKPQVIEALIDYFDRLNDQLVLILKG